MVYKLGAILLFVSLLGLVGCAKDSIPKNSQETVKPQTQGAVEVGVKDTPAEKPNVIAEVRHFGDPEIQVLDLAFSPDGYLALSACSDKTVRLWDLESGKEIHRLTGHTDYVFSVTFSPDGRLGLSGGADGAVCLWNLENGKMIRRFQILKNQSKEQADYEQYITSVIFSPDGHQALFGAGDSTIRLWDMKAWKEIRRFKGHSEQVNSVAFSPNGLQAISCSGEYEGDSTVLIWDVTTGKKIGSLEDEGYFSVINCVAFSHDGRQAMASCGSGQDHPDGKIIIWDLKSRSVVRRLEVDKAGVSSPAFLPNDRRVIFAGSTPLGHGTIYLWDLKSGKEIYHYTEKEQEIESMALSRDGHRALSGSRDGTIRLFNLPQ
jgi:WD40 repeat protein